MEFVLLNGDTIIEYADNVSCFDDYYTSGEYNPAVLVVNLYMSLEEYMALPSSKRMISGGRPIAEVIVNDEIKWLYVYLKPSEPALLKEHVEISSPISPFVALIYRLRYIPRWSMMRNYERENVAEHSFMVAIIAHMLVSIGIIEFGRENVSAEDVAVAALWHESSEIFIGDLPSVTKTASPEMLEQCRKLEDLAEDKMLRMLPDRFQYIYEPLVHQRNVNTKKYVKAADLLDAYLKASKEVEGGNRDFIAAKRGIENKIKDLQMEEVDYFMRVFVPAFSMTIDELHI